MQNISIRDPSRSPKEEFDKEPVYYCKQCLSLKILTIPDLEDCNFCDECNSTNIEQINIHDWEKLYEHRYGHKFINH